MSRYNDLFIGDMHAQISNLADTEALLQFIYETAVRLQVTRIIFLGDLFHTHAVVRQEIAHLYRAWIRKMCDVAVVRILAGNHDGISPTNAKINACDAVLSGCDYDCNNPLLVIDSDWSDDEYQYFAFMHNNEKFVELVNETAKMKPNRILVCHGNFNGAASEHGAPIPGGVDANKIIFPVIISGHIHNAQEVGKVLFLGTPRQVTRSEANSSKFIYHLTGESATAFNLQKVCTDHLVKRYFSLNYKESDGVKKIDLSASNVKTVDEVRASVEGSEEFYNQFIKENVDLVGRVRFIPKIVKKLDGKVSIEESEGDIKQAMKKYVFDIADIKSDMKEKVWQKLSGLI